ncbi:hypothetical protein [Allorhodopirellula heiligendammensis]|uniref:hypothetical protein n=1 Tax=Allorhodopirellula heiligendammensis TaxID=2714739 RepID=UPI0011B84EC3|nr:hypothetical protein [Allorhodopirellula heiligendammensis]
METVNPTYVNEVDQVIRDGLLAGFKALLVSLKFQRDGVKYDDLSNGEKEEYGEKFYDEEEMAWYF